MKRFVISVAAVLGLGLANAQAASTTPVTGVAPWASGWDNATEPFDSAHTSVAYTLDPVTRTLTVKLSLVHAQPGKLYQLGVLFYCKVMTAYFGPFPVTNLGAKNACLPLTAQGVTATVAQVELGVATTDVNGNAALSVAISPVILPAVGLKVSFFLRDGTGCNLANANGDNVCAVDFQSPGPTFGTSTLLLAP